MKKYKLLKDLPGVRAGSIFELDGQLLCNKQFKSPVEPHFDLEIKYIHDWFEEIKQETK